MNVMILNDMNFVIKILKSKSLRIVNIIRNLLRNYLYYLYIYNYL